MRHYTLYELEKLTGILGATIRVWERRYNIIKPKRTETNRRLYDDNDLRRLINISVIYNSGVKISKIAGYSESELVDKAEFLTRASAGSDKQINSLIIAMLSYNSMAVNEIILRSVMNTGFEETFLNVVFPFMRRVGVMWHTGSVNAGGEHFISNILRARLISAIESLPSPAHDHKVRRVMMFLPEKELHELGLLFYSYVIRKMGHEVLYLGQTTPFSALVEVTEKWRPDMLFTGAQTELSINEPEKYLKNLSSTFDSQKILVSGSLAKQPVLEKLRNVFPIKQINDLQQYF